MMHQSPPDTKARHLAWSMVVLFKRRPYQNACFRLKPGRCTNATSVRSKHVALRTQETISRRLSMTFCSLAAKSLTSNIQGFPLMLPSILTSGYHISPIHRIFPNNSVNILSLLASQFFPTLPHVTTHFSISTSVHMVAFNVSKTSTRDKSHTYMFRNTVEELTALLQVKGLGVLEPQK